MKFNVTIASTIIALSSCSSLIAQEIGNARGLIIESPYDVVSGWLKPFQEQGYAFGGNSAVWADASDRIFINQRGETSYSQRSTR
jgi:hypothetical protein